MVEHDEIDEVEKCVSLRIQRCLAIGDRDATGVRRLDAALASFPVETFQKATNMICSVFHPALN